MLGSQAAAGAHHGAMRLGMLQGMGRRVVQRRLGMWVLELELRFELLLLLVHTGRPIVRKRLWGEVGATVGLGPLGGICFQSVRVFWDLR